MGTKQRLRAALLPQKLKQIRQHLGCSQSEMLRRLGYEHLFDRSTISHYESGEREPPLPVLLAYGQTVNIYVDFLIDDNCELELPNKTR